MTMNVENAETRDDRPANGPDAPPGPDPSSGSNAPADLVAQMVAAGEWPEPALLERILQAGDAAVDPLREVLRSGPRGWPAEAPLDHAMGLLSILKAPRAVPDLIAIVKTYSDESSDSAVEALEDYGPGLFDTLLELVQDLGFRKYSRIQVMDVLKSFAQEDPERIARLSEVARRLLVDAVERGREEARRKREGADDENDAPDGAVEEESRGTGPDPSEGEFSSGDEIAFLIADLAGLADPEARELIKAAFAEELVETWIIDEEAYEKHYKQAREGTKGPRWPDRDWLQNYRDNYQEHLEFQKKPRSSPELPSSFLNTSRSGALEMPVEPPPPPAPIRNTNPRIGRNDPCWCGSGKKYKKCHLGKDGPK